MYRNFHRLRDHRLRDILVQIVSQIVFIVLLVALNLYTANIDVKTQFSLNERTWVCQTLTEVALLYTVIVVFKVFTIGVSPAELEYRVKITVLIVFTLLINIRIIYMYFEGLEINKESYDLINNEL